MPDHPIEELRPYLPDARALFAIMRGRRAGTWDGQTLTDGGNVSVATVEELAEMSDADLLNLQHVGPVALRALRAAQRQVLGTHDDLKVMVEPHRLTLQRDDSGQLLTAEWTDTGVRVDGRVHITDRDAAEKLAAFLTREDDDA
jgi:hypothetical protein